MKTLIFWVLVFAVQSVWANDSTLYVILERERFGYINGKGEIVIPPVFRYGGDFYNNLAVARLDSGFGYINKKGEFVIPPIYDYATDFVDNVARVSSPLGSFEINIRGEKLAIEDSPLGWWCTNDIGIQLEEEVVRKNPFELVETEGENKIIKHKHMKRELPIKVKDADWRGFVGNLMLVKKLDNKLAYIDATGSIVWEQKEPYNQELHTLNVDFKPILEEVNQELKPEALQKESFSGDSSRIGSFLSVIEAENVKLSGSLTGMKLKLAYQSPYLEDTIRLGHKHLQFKLQLVDESGKNKTIENVSLISMRSYIPFALESDRSVPLKLLPQHFFTFVLPKLEGFVKARCVYECYFSGEYIKTLPFDCSYNPSQLINKHSSHSTRFIDTALGRGKRWPMDDQFSCGIIFRDCYD